MKPQANFIQFLDTLRNIIKDGGMSNSPGYIYQTRSMNAPPGLNGWRGKRDRYDELNHPSHLTNEREISNQPGITGWRGKRINSGLDNERYYPKMKEHKYVPKSKLLHHKIMKMLEYGTLKKLFA